MHAIPSNETCPVRAPLAPQRRERGVLWVVLLTALTMVVEIVAGYAMGSMALLADGWHMATHVGALGIASLAYSVSRRYAQHRAFVFGTGKVRTLAGYTSAVALGLVAAFMVVESLMRLVEPQAIDFGNALPVAVIGLVVNVVSVLVLHAHDDDEDDHDHNHRAALFHVIADIFTSALAILALVAGRFLGWTWLDATTGVVGGIVILKWGFDLARHAATELLDVEPSSLLETEIRTALEGLEDVRVRDLHVWSLGGTLRSCVVTIITATPRDVQTYRAELARFGLSHLTIEVHRCPDDHGPTPQRG
jgi:cation diffusion facilitator family transporter